MLELIPDALFRVRNEVLRFVSINLSKSGLTIIFAIVSVTIFRRGAEGPLTAALIINILFGIYFIFYMKDKEDMQKTKK